MIYLATKSPSNKPAGKINNFVSKSEDEKKKTNKKTQNHYIYVNIPKANISFAHNKCANELSIQEQVRAKRT